MTEPERRATKRFRMLLRLLPAEFRGDFGQEMEQVFVELREEAAREGGKMGVWRLWWETAKGIFTTAPREHLSMLRQDSTFALRMMRKNLGFTIAAIIVLGLGIGANTAIFSVVNAVLLKPLPYQHGERLLMLRQATIGAGLMGRSVSVPELMDYRRQNRSLDAIVEYHNMQFILLGRVEPEQVETGVVSWNYFDIFGAKPLVGRNFSPDDEKPGAPAVLLLSYEYWLRSFGGDPTVIGKVFRMNDKPHTVIGVLPPFPQYPQENDVYMPSTACPFRMDPMMMASRTDRMVRMFGRMKPGVRTAQAEADLSAVAANMQKEFPDAYPQDSALKVDAAPLKSELTRDAKPTMLFLLAAAGFVLLIACATSPISISPAWSAANANSACAPLWAPAASASFVSSSPKARYSLFSAARSASSSPPAACSFSPPTSLASRRALARSTSTSLCSCSRLASRSSSACSPAPLPPSPAAKISSPP